MQNYYLAINGIPQGEGNPSSTEALTPLSVSLAPNPASSYVRISSPDPIAQYQILDLTGRVILSAQAGNTTQVNIALDALTKGMYLVKVQTEQGKTGTQKLVIGQ